MSGTVGVRIEGMATIVDRGTTHGPKCSLEIPFLTLELDGQQYRWISENAADYAFNSVSRIRITAFVRPNMRLYHVAVLEAPELLDALGSRKSEL